MSDVQQQPVLDAREDEEEEKETLYVKKHIKFFQRTLSVLPYRAKNLDVNR